MRPPLQGGIGGSVEGRGERCIVESGRRGAAAALSGAEAALTPLGVAAAKVKGALDASGAVAPTCGRQTGAAARDDVTALLNGTVCTAGTQAARYKGKLKAS